MALRHAVIVNDFAHVNGGAAQVALSSALGLAGRGLKVSVVAAVGPAMPELADAGVRVFLAGQQELLKDPLRWRAALQGLWNFKGAALMKEALKGSDRAETVVHLHGWGKSLSSSVVHEAAGLGFRALCTVHDYLAACPNGGFYNYRRSCACALKPMSLPCLAEDCDPRSYSHKLWRAARQAVQRTWGGIPDKIHGFIFASRFSYDILKPHLPAGVLAHFIDHPVDADQAPPAAVRENELYSFVGRLSAEKGALLFAEASAKCKATAVFAGDGPLKARIAAANPAAELPGWMSRAEVAGLLKRSRALVYPTSVYETFGLSVLEAASLGVPAVVSRGSAAGERVEDGVTGLLFEAGNVDDLADKLSRLRDGKLAAGLGEAAYRQYWSRPLTMEKHLDALLNVYEGALP